MAAEAWKFSSPTIRNVGLCCLVWLVGVSVLFLQITTTSTLTTRLVGTRLSTVPVGVFLVSSAFSSGVVPRLIVLFGGRATYMAFYSFAAVGAVIQFCGVKYLAKDDPMGTFGLLVAGAIPQGMSNACTNNVRFTSTIFVSPENAPMVISTVIFWGVLAALLGPEVSKYTAAWLTEPFAGTYILAIIYWLILVLISFSIDWPKVPPRTAPGTAAATGRPMKEIASNPLFIFAMCMQTISFASMAGMMVATPVAMGHNSLSFDASLSVIEAHLVGMFAPALFTSSIIASIGVLPTILSGMLVMFSGTCCIFAGNTVYEAYMVGLFFIGIGWAWSYVGATSLFVKQFRPDEKGKVLSLNDFVIFSAVAIVMTSCGSYLAALESNFSHFAGTYCALQGLGIVITIAAIALDATGERRAKATAARGLEEGSKPSEKTSPEASGGGSGALVMSPLPPMPPDTSWGLGGIVWGGGAIPWSARHGTGGSLRGCLWGPRGCSGRTTTGCATRASESLLLAGSSMFCGGEGWGERPDHTSHAA